MTIHQQPPVLVLGDTGKAGRRIVGQLTTCGLPVRIGARGAPRDFADYAAKSAPRGTRSPR